jgi:hypothetical protein
MMKSRPWKTRFAARMVAALTTGGLALITVSAADAIPSNVASCARLPLICPPFAPTRQWATHLLGTHYCRLDIAAFEFKRIEAWCSVAGCQMFIGSSRRMLDSIRSAPIIAAPTT